jgi:DNA modification methylase
MPPIHIEPSKLRTSPSNPRAIRDNAMEKLMLSIAEDPELMEARPLIVNDRMEVLAGNQRLRACIALEWPTVPCVVVDWDEAKQRRAMIKDNVSAGEWDQDMLANEWEVEELKDMGLNLDWDEPEETEGLTDPDDVPEVLEEPTTKLGDVWLLGEHRVMCGDSTKAEDVERLMNGDKADMVFTDPPYGMHLDADYSTMVNKNGVAGKKHNNIIGDHADYDPTHIFKMFPITKEIIIFGADYFSHLLPNRNQGSWLVWDKRVTENYDKVIGSAFEMLWSMKKRKREILRFEYSSWGARMEGATSEGKPHPTMKPVNMLIAVLKKTKTNLIVDLFLGSGSTLIAAEKTGRKCYGMELDPAYCDVIIKRWEDFTGKKATLWKQ